MAKTLYLHVGMPKCASTSIQGVLRTHADLFAEHGKFYDIPPRDRTEGQGNVTGLLADIRNRRTSKVREALSFFLDRDSDVILSSEMFIGLARNSLADDLIARAREDGFTPKLICYVRRQDHWIESDYKQHIKGGSDWDDAIGALVKTRIKNKVLDYHWLLKNWERSVGRDNMTVVPLQSGQDDLYPLQRFLEFLDMDPALAGDLAIARQNVSPPVGLIEPMRYLKRALRLKGMKSTQIPKPLHVFLNEAPGRIEVPQRRYLLSHKRRVSLLERYEKSNAALSRDYLGGQPAFDTDVQDDGVGSNTLATEAASVLAAWIVSNPEQLERSGTDAAAQADPSGERRRRLRQVWRYFVSKSR
ncbi:hypothetical protein DU478_20440 [Thalassococcus profundi]|uniref:Sulfotransferase family protein n=1 Tax=Thalassococcus profundi TaxID=2282382 RepID=A0A369TG83_9RHOB|nr:hypothetical protein [Thalassococcus profundi]RDD64369.1 hypothetical protein DU478_20440 [Thalassococcus profundi]